MKRACLVVGAGFSGATVARVLAEAGIPVQVIDKRDHLAGNCHCERDQNTGILLHAYGPHIFHTDDPVVWTFVQKFARFLPYDHRVKATANGKVYGLPITLHTLNQVFERTMSPPEAKVFLARLTYKIEQPRNFEEQALATIGQDLYELFFKGYTQKQWGRHPREIPARVFLRLPLRFSYDDRYFTQRFQGIPADGYTQMVHAMLDHPRVETQPATAFHRQMIADHEHTFFTGSLDDYFGRDMGTLPYRTLDFAHQIAVGDQQGCAVMNFPDASVTHTRVTEHKHFAPWEKHRETVVTKEFSRDAEEGDIPFYPLRAVGGEELLTAYRARAEQLTNVTFLGRLGTYRYLDMDKAIAEALAVARGFLARQSAQLGSEALFKL
jgi:UDP-galactopyranose mutase